MSFADFFSMGGYAFYVWGSYGVAALVFAGEVILLRRRRRTLLRRASRMNRSVSTGAGHETQT